MGINSGADIDVAALFESHESERFGLHSRHLNEQMVRVLRTIGYDVGFCKGRGQYLYDRDDNRYLDMLSGFGVFALGRNHPAIRAALKSVLDADLPNLVQMDVSTLAGLLAERLLALVPHLDKVFFANSGAESVEAAIKFARAATGRSGIAYCSHAFHGLTYGALSLNGDETFRRGFEPLLPDCVCVPFNDLAALDRALSSRRMAAFVVEPIQGKGVILPDDDYLQGRAGSLPPLRDAVHRRRDPDRDRTHRQVPRRRALGHRARHGAARQGAVRRACAGRRRADAQMDLRQGVQPHGPCGGARLDLLEERSRDGGRHRDARGAEGRAGDRERGAHRRAADARARRARRATTSC